MLPRILTVAEAYDAMTSEQPYLKAMSEDAALEEIRKNAGTQFDPVIAKIFIEKVLGQARIIGAKGDNNGKCESQAG